MGGAAHYDVDDPTFIEDLERSDAAVIRVALWLRRRGQHVHIPPLRVRPTAEEMADYSDAGDLFISKDGASWKRVEVTVRGLAFTSRGDFPYQTMIVEVAHRWDAPGVKPAIYIRLNKAMTHMAIVRAESSPHWQRRTRHDAGKHRDRTFMECPIEHIQFVAPNGF